MNRWTTELDHITTLFSTQFGSLTQAELNWKPSPSTWSIAQNIDHLIVVNGTYFPVLAALKAGTYSLPFTAKAGFLVSFFGNTVLEAVRPDRRKRMKTFPVWEPSASTVEGNILRRFVDHQRELKQQIIAAGPFLQNRTVISSPANKYIVYTLETAFDIIVSHEMRHFEQAKEVMSHMKDAVIR
jgi:hypothetical protein